MGIPKSDDAVLVFVASRTIKDMTVFAKTYKKLFPEHDVLVLSGENTNNAEAAKLTIKQSCYPKKS